MLPVHLEQVCAQFRLRDHRCVFGDVGLLPDAVCQFLTQGAGPGHFFYLLSDGWPIYTFAGQYLSPECLGETDEVGQGCLLVDSRKLGRVSL